MRLIDADALIAKAYIMQEPNGFIHSVVTERQIAKVPNIDAVPVVRCGECEKRDKSADLTNDVFCRWFEAVMSKTDFCSAGERKEADGDG